MKMMNDAQYKDSVTYGRHKVPFEVVRTPRKTLGINVHPDGRVEVRAPLDADADEIRSRVQHRSRWILRSQRHFASLVRPTIEKEYISGETHRYLGRQYRLKVMPIPEGGRPGVRLVGRYFEIYSPEPGDPSRTQSLLGRWYRKKARTHLIARFDASCQTVRRYGIERPEMNIRTMPNRWGSCTPAGRILLNPLLVLAPGGCIDYVIVHELCHLSHPHHGRAFYELLERVMPDWSVWKCRLEQVQ